MDTLKIELEWLEAPGVRDPALARSWSRFALYSSKSTITKCSDEQGAGAIRTSIYGSLLPLAEWALVYWYHLLDGRREAPNQQLLQRNWRRRHAWRAGREGQSFPDLVTHRQGDDVVFKWHSDANPIFGTSVRFLQDGELRLTRTQADLILSEQFMAVLARRLDDSSDQRARSFCEAWYKHQTESISRTRLRQIIGRLGLLESDLTPDLDRLITKLAKKDLNPVVDAVIDAANPEFLESDTQWALEIWNVCQKSPLWDRQTRRIQEKVEDQRTPQPSRRWEVGWKRAEKLRQFAPDLQPKQKAPPAAALRKYMCELLGITGSELQQIRQNSDEELDDVVAWAPNRRPTFILAYDRSTEAKSFRLARDLHAVLFEGEPSKPFARVSSGYLAGSFAAGNAFATELLAPVDFVKKKLGSQKFISERTVESLASELKVQPQLVRHQIENHQLGTIYS